MRAASALGVAPRRPRMKPLQPALSQLILALRRRRPRPRRCTALAATTDSSLPALISSFLVSSTTPTCPTAAPPRVGTVLVTCNNIYPGGLINARPMLAPRNSFADSAICQFQPPVCNRYPDPRSHTSSAASHRRASAPLAFSFGVRVQQSAALTKTLCAALKWNK